MHLLELFVSSHSGLDDVDHLVQQEGGQERCPLNGRPCLVLLAPVPGTIEIQLTSWQIDHIERQSSAMEIFLLGDWHLEHLRVRDHIQGEVWLAFSQRLRKPIGSKVLQGLRATQQHEDLPRHLIELELLDYTRTSTTAS